MTPEQASALRAPFPPEAIGKIPKGGTWLDYVGHAAVTDRLLSVDPECEWQPMAFNDDSSPSISQRGNDSVLWIHLTVCGVTRHGVGIVATKSFELEKQLISDAIRNAAMRFGVALDLWSKEDLGHNENAEAGSTVTAASQSGPAHSGPSSATSPARRQALKSRCVALQADGVSVAEGRESAGLPPIDKCNDEQLTHFEQLVGGLEAKLTAPFVPVPTAVDG